MGIYTLPTSSRVTQTTPEAATGGGGSGVTVEDEGTPLTTTADTLDFVGAGVDATGTGTTKTITIPGGGSGITVEDEGTPLTTTATTLDFVGNGVDATGTGSSKTITIPGGITVEDEGTPLTTIADTLDFVGTGVDATGTGTTKTITFDYLDPDVTDNVTVGYTTDVEADVFGATVTPVLTLEHFKTMTVTSNFTLAVPTGGNGHCEYYLTVTGTGPYTMTAGTNVQLIDAFVTLTVGENYILNIHRYSSTNAVAQLIELP